MSESIDELDYLKYGKSFDTSTVKRRRKKCKECTECLRAFLKSGDKGWKVNKSSLPAKDPNIILSSLKWRVDHFPEEFGNIRVFMSKGEIYLERGDENE